jgi:glyoxylase I family protein
MMDLQNEQNAPEIRGMAPYFEVFDMPVTLKFYRDILGFKIIMSSGEGDDVDWLLLRLNDMELMFNTAYEKQNRPPAPDPIRTLGHRDVTLYFGCPDTEALYEYLIHKGLDPQKPSITGYGWKAIYLTDPDGYQLCFHWPVEQEGLS